jgi:hypothetical protein
MNPGAQDVMIAARRYWLAELAGDRVKAAECAGIIYRGLLQASGWEADADTTDASDLLPLAPLEQAA